MSLTESGIENVSRASWGKRVCIVGATRSKKESGEVDGE